MNFRKTSHGFYTHTHWKCSYEEEPGWYTTRFDDSHWEPSVVSHARFSYYNEDSYFSDFGTESKFIWASNYTYSVIYCRARLCHGIMII